ncbi:hypothetical protein WJX81_006036 [Elliptochloris bilobata]|uniref:very-long-chain 3-oxoacyl-CoA synthase n=1 Tax=Elliptochloris bilobata TaxID=381761 RepID=A0AAW1RRG0_9CHLO
MGRTGGSSLAAARTVLCRSLPAFRRKVMLLEFAIYEPPESILLTYVEQVALEYRCGLFDPETVDTMVWLHESKHNAVGDRTAVPPGLSQAPMDTSYAACVAEARLVMLDVAAKALAAAAVAPAEVDIVITVSGFSATPSLASMVACHLAMRSDVKALSLSGHGCAGGIVGIDLAQTLLEGTDGRLALLIMHENITNGLYAGNDEAYLPANILFTLGGAAALLSSRRQDRPRAKYELQHAARHLCTADEKANACIGFRDDSSGHRGVYIDTDVLKAAAVGAISSTLRRLAPRVLPLRELAKVARDKRYQPDFSKAFQHLAVHPGALPVIRKVAQALRFSAQACQPSIDTLERYGNTGCASTFYILAHIEHHRGVRRGERVMQIAMGTGFKCAAAAWRARRTQASRHAVWAPARAPFAKHAAGYTRPRALALAAEQEAALRGAEDPRARALAAAAASCELGPDGLEVADCAAKRAAEAVGGDGGALDTGVSPGGAAAAHVNVDAIDVEGCTALHQASRHGHLQVVEVLLRHGADARAEDLRGNTPAHLAAAKGHLAILTALLQAVPTPDVDARNADGVSVRDYTSAALDADDVQAWQGEEPDQEAAKESEPEDAASGDWDARLREEAWGSDADEAAWSTFGAEWDAAAAAAGGHGAGPAPEDADAYAQRLWEEMQRRQRAKSGAAGPSAAAQETWGAADAAARARDGSARARAEAAAADAAARSARILEEERARDAAWRRAVLQGDVGARRAAYEARWAVLAGARADAPLAAADVPWLPTAAADARDVVLYGAVGAEAARRRVRAELMRWHPDKFGARFGAWLAASERAGALERVKAVAQMLTELAREVATGAAGT